MCKRKFWVVFTRLIKQFHYHLPTTLFSGPVLLQKPLWPQNKKLTVINTRRWKNADSGCRFLAPAVEELWCYLLLYGTSQTCSFFSNLFFSLNVNYTFDFAIHVYHYVGL